MNILRWSTGFAGRFFQQSDNVDSPDRYGMLRKKIVLLMVLVTIIPLTIMAVINNYEYQKSIKAEIVNIKSLLVIGSNLGRTVYYRYAHIKDPVIQ